MKIEPPKNHSIDRQESKNVFKTESSVFHPSRTLKTSDPAPAAAASTAGAFSKILEETRHQTDKENSAPSKTDSPETDSSAQKSEKDEKATRVADERKETEERGRQNGDGETDSHGDEQQSPAMTLAALPSQGLARDAKAPAARSILHVADLERIVSTIRTETFQNQKQITIALKNSVLQGLQIRLTLSENGKVKAEFLALDEQIKKQLRERKTELSEILKNRSALFSEIEIKSQNTNEPG